MPHASKRCTGRKAWVNPSAPSPAAAKSGIARRTANLIPGRKSLSGDGTVSPVLQFRTPRKREVEALAEEMGIRPSELARRALDEYLDDHARGA
jgi:hypothetical protein